MVKYNCEICGKEFSQKSSYDSHKKRKTPCVNKLKVASMFAGCGGLDYVFHKKSNIFDVVYVNDFDKDSCNTYENYYKHKPICEDITKIETIPDCDILTGGFPCQGFSIANLYRKETDNRNKLYLELVRLLKLK